MALLTILSAFTLGTFRSSDVGHYVRSWKQLCFETMILLTVLEIGDMKEPSSRTSPLEFGWNECIKFCRTIKLDSKPLDLDAAKILGRCLKFSKSCSSCFRASSENTKQTFL